MRQKLAFVPEVVASYGHAQRGSATQLDVVTATPRAKRLLIGEAKWGREKLARQVLTDLIQRSQKMPQVKAGWATQYALFARQGFTPALQQAAHESGALLVSLDDLEQMLIEAAG